MDVDTFESVRCVRVQACGINHLSIVADGEYVVQKILKLDGSDMWGQQKHDASGDTFTGLKLVVADDVIKIDAFLNVLSASSGVPAV